jgi:hypothetical protein
MPQTAVDNMAPYLAGQLADSGRNDVLSKTSEEASAEIPYGVMVAQGTADDGVVLLAATTDVLVGVSVLSHDYAVGVEVGDTGYKPKTTFGVLNVGRIAVLVEEAVTPASSVYVRAVAAGAEVKGAFRDTADGTDTIDISSFARYVTSAGAGEIAIVDIDMRNRNA